jgi:hypothetical protein
VMLNFLLDFAEHGAAIDFRHGITLAIISDVRIGNATVRSRTLALGNGEPSSTKIRPYERPSRCRWE